MYTICSVAVMEFGDRHAGRRVYDNIIYCGCEVVQY